ncbi:MAG: monovalent cation/H+ antiporter subunit E [Halobacteriota archaeon]
MSEPAADRLLVPVKRSVTLRNTVSYAIEEACASGTKADPSSVHFVFLATWRDTDPGTDAERDRIADLLERVEFWAELDLQEGTEEDELCVTVETAIVGADRYLFNPADYAAVLNEYAEENDLDRVIVDPEYTLVGHTTLLQPLEFELAQTPLSVEEAPVERPTRRSKLVGNTSRPRFVGLFGLSFLFYQVLGGFGGSFDVVTGAITGLVVALTLSNISFYHEPSLRTSPKRIARGLIYVPYLFWEIVKSNVVVARVILDPRLPIDPRLTKVRMIVGSGLPIVTLANSITLTPGTLTVRADDQELYVHSLLPWAREGLFEGGLERWVRFVFYGRSAARFPSPEERGDTEVLQQPVATDGGGVPSLTDSDTDGNDRGGDNS